MSSRSRRPRRSSATPGTEVADLERAGWTRSVTSGASGWVWPLWLERQLDPRSPSFVPTGALPYLANVTNRGWTTIGNVGSGRRATVDARGLVTIRAGGWSLDWWVGAEDRWHLPSREPAVRQRLVADAPVVETAMRVPGGDILHRAFAIRSAPSDGGRELVVVEVENATPVPVALAVSVRPYDTEGLSSVERIALEGGGADAADIVTVDGRVAIVLPRLPNRAAGSVAATGDVASIVLAGEAGTAFPGDLRCEAGLASAAFVYPLAHRTTTTFLLPLDAWTGTGRRRTVPRSRPTRPTGTPSASQVANGWKAHAAQGMRLVLPDRRLAEAVEACRRSLLLLHRVAEDGERSGAVTASARMLVALDRLGAASDVAESIPRLVGRQGVDGSITEADGSDATGAVLHVVGEHWRLHRDRASIDGLAPVVAAAVERLDRSHPGGGTAGGAPAALLSLRGVLDAAVVLAALDEGQAAADATACAARRRGDVAAWLAALGSAPAGPHPSLDPTALHACAARWPLHLVAAADVDVAAVADLVRAQACVGPAVFDAAGTGGLSPSLTLGLAALEVEAGDRRALERLDWVLSAASATWTWPQAIHPRVDGGCAGAGHDGRVAADLLDLVRHLLVRETDGGGLALCSLVPDDWLGQQLEVHDAPTAHGLLSFAVRWHGDRPALLWELQPHDPTVPVLLTAPGLDRGWSTTDLRGDALLAPVPPPAPLPDPAPDPVGPATPVRLTPRRPAPPT